MKNKHINLLLAFCLPVSLLSAQAPVITSATPLSNSVEQWSKFEVKLGVNATWSNPYDYSEIRASAVFIDPDGLTTTVDGFFMQEYGPINTQTGAANPVGNGAFKVRFAPNKTGTWRYVLSCTNAAGAGTFPEQTFQVTSVNHPQNKGFVRANQTNYLHFDAGDQFIPVGENIGWQNGNIYLDYTNWLTKLNANGGNFFRLWHATWGLGIEWKNGINGFEGLRKYKQNTAFYQDWLFDYCAAHGIYVQLCMNYHGQVSSQVNPEWSDSPYNSANGGPCVNTWDFFTSIIAKNHVRNRLRYIVARWGYARSIMDWELFNEVDWTDQFDQRKGDVVNWHSEMAAFLKQIDPYQHLVSSSYALDYNDPALWNLPNIDFTQTHYYINTSNLERALAGGSGNYLDDYAKPTLTAEFGLGFAGAQLTPLDPNGIHIHNALWGALYGGGLGSGMTWWWDDYIAPLDLYYHFLPVSILSHIIPFRSSNLAPAAASISGAPADLLLQPTQGWGALSDTAFTIVNGVVTPAGATLGQFLYGSQWNTQFRRPPVFHVTYTASGTFKVKTGSDTGQSPKIAIWLDGVKVLEQTAAVNQTYSINVPAGSHVIKVDNTGTDWIIVSSYSFSGQGTGVDAYVLKAEDKTMVAGWVLSNRYNHEYLKANGAPAAITGAMLSIPDVQNGNYTIRYYDCLTGALVSSAPVSVSNGTLNVALPTLLWDLAFTVSNQLVNTVEANQHLEFRIYPNPAAPGKDVTVNYDIPDNKPVSVSLLDMGGRTMETLRTVFSAQQTTLTVPADTPAGFYWLKLEGANGSAGVKGIVIGN